MTKSEMLDHFPVEAVLKDCVSKAVEARKLAICRHLMNNHNSESNLMMKTFDWDIKFIIGNSSLASHREQKVTLIFDCDKNKSSETLSVEMGKQMIDQMINELEAISSSAE